MRPASDPQSLADLLPDVLELFKRRGIVGYVSPDAEPAPPTSQRAVAPLRLIVPVPDED